MTAEGPTGAPLRQQIAEAIHATGYDCLYDDLNGSCQGPEDHLGAADAVLALLNLTEERHPVSYNNNDGLGEHYHHRLVGPWFPSHHTDSPNEKV